MSSTTRPSSSSLSNLQAYDSDEAVSPSPLNNDGERRNIPGESVSSCLSEPSEGPPTKGPKTEIPSNTEKDSEPKPSLTSIRNDGEGARKQALPLPQNILEMFSSESKDQEQYNDPSLHMGRQRSFPHVRGNWASFLYLPCSCSDNNDEDHVLSKLQSLIEEAAIEYEGVHLIHIIDDKHVTLSRTLSFRHHWIDGFVNNIRNAVRRCRRIQLVLEGFSIYVNDEKSRTFISMKVSSTEGLLSVVKLCDECLAEYELPSYYKDPSFHISCAWMLGDTREWAESELLPFLNTKWKQLMEEDVDMQVHSVDAVEFKTGNRHFRFPFNNGL